MEAMLTLLGSNREWTNGLPLVAAVFVDIDVGSESFALFSSNLTLNKNNDFFKFLFFITSPMNKSIKKFNLSVPR